jgi:hypothetical protein
MIDQPQLFRSIDDMDNIREKSLKRRVLRIASTIGLTILAFAGIILGTVLSE